MVGVVGIAGRAVGTAAGAGAVERTVVAVVIVTRVAVGDVVVLGDAVVGTSADVTAALPGASDAVGAPATVVVEGGTAVDWSSDAALQPPLQCWYIDTIVSIIDFRMSKQ